MRIRMIKKMERGKGWQSGLGCLAIGRDRLTKTMIPVYITFSN